MNQNFRLHTTKLSLRNSLSLKKFQARILSTSAGDIKPRRITILLPNMQSKLN